MLERSGSIEGFFMDGFDASDPDIGGALDSFASRAMALDLRAAYGRRFPRAAACAISFRARLPAARASG